VWENVRGQSQSPSKTEDMAELKEMVQMYTVSGGVLNSMQSLLTTELRNT